MPKFWYDAEVATMADRYGLDRDLVRAVVEVESSGRTHAYRYEPAFWLRYMTHKPEFDGAVPERVSASYGLMQVMYTTALQHGFTGAPEQLFVPLVGLEYGCRHLRHLLDEAGGDRERALAQYNGGSKGNTSRPFRNQYYVNKVLKALEQVKHGR